MLLPKGITMDRNKWASPEKMRNLVFGFDILYRQLQIFASKEDAIVAVEGLTIAEGDYRFFSADGSPLEACFSIQPFVNAERNTYSNGKYTLEPILTGTHLSTILAVVECADEAKSGLSTLRDVEQFLIDQSLALRELGRKIEQTIDIPGTTDKIVLWEGITSTLR